jgi:hypothetical protein
MSTDLERVAGVDLADPAYLPELHRIVAPEA